MCIGMFDSNGCPVTTGIGSRVSRSIARQSWRSSASQNDSATPAAPARAVRPMRWT